MRPEGITTERRLGRRFGGRGLGGALGALVGAVMVALAPWGAVWAQVPGVQVTETTDDPQAVTLSVRGDCDVATDGVRFSTLTRGQVLKQGAVLRTGADSRADLFFRRIGTTVRMQPGTEIRLERMVRRLKDGKPAMETLVEVRSGRIFTVVRSMVAGSVFEIRNAAGRSVVEGGGGDGRYIVTADGTHVTEKNSGAPLKLIRETGITVIAPGMKYQASEGKVFPVAAPDAVAQLIEFDELHALAEGPKP